ncbi:MAG: oligoribonuclease [Gammaproteobacteria bacterium]|nr:oligoribonuclease [Gammaproteobacteria bacterium]
MTGLEPSRDRIIEIATIVTDLNLEVIAEGPVIAVHQPEPILALMDEWNRQHHGASGLIERVRQSSDNEAAAEAATLAFLAAHTTAESAPMCGNSICQDRRFLAQWMPRLEAFFNYRNMDVSTLKILSAAWYQGRLQKFKKGDAHQALSDIRESIDELRFYREHLLK